MVHLRWLRPIYRGLTDDRQASHQTSKGQALRLKQQDDVGQVIKQLKENSGLEKEHKGLAWETQKSYSDRAVPQEPIEELAWTETVIRLLHKGYWNDPDFQPGPQDLIIRKRWHKKIKIRF